MMQDSQLQALISILNECCIDNKIVPRSVLFEKFESITNSGMEIYRFKKALSFLIKENKICGFKIRQGRNGGVYRESPQERVSLSCSVGNFTGYISHQELEKLISGLSQTKESYTNGNSIHRS